MTRHAVSVLFVLSLLLVVPVLAQEASTPEEEAKVNEIVVEILGLKSDEGQIGCRIDG